MAGNGSPSSAAEIFTEGLKLIQAAGKGDDVEVGRLLALDSDVNEHGGEPIVGVVSNRQLLLGVSTEIEKFTALHIAASAGHNNVVDKLVAAIRSLGVSEGVVKEILNSRDCIGRTPLHHASWMQRGAVTKTLLSCKEVDVNAEDNDHFTPAHLLLIKCNGHVEALRPLLSHPDIRLDREATQSEATRTTLNSIQPLEDWWREDAHIPTLSHYILPDSSLGSTPLQLIVSESLQTESQREDLKVLDTVWDLEIKSVRDHVVSEIINQLRPIVTDRAADEKLDMKTLTVMHLVAYVGLPRLMRILARRPEYLFQINAETSDKKTPLHLAALGGNLEVVEFLNEQPTLRGVMADKSGQTAVELAFEVKQDNIFRFLMERQDVKDYVGMLHSDRSVYVDGTNAILVGAALIASITFGGWLQPPLGYQQYDQYPSPGAPSDAFEQYATIEGHISVKIFWISNSLSFYAAIATILAGAGAVITRQDLFLREEVTRLRGALALTSFAFSWAVVFVVVAFTAAGFASLPPVAKYEVYMICTTFVGLVFSCITFSIARSSNPGFYSKYYKYVNPAFYFSASLSLPLKMCYKQLENSECAHYSATDRIKRRKFRPSTPRN